MPRSAETLRKNLNQAGAAYKGFLARQKSDRFFTENQKKERKHTFLESHVGIFDEYFSLPGKGSRELNRDAAALADDVAKEFPSSITGRQLKPIIAADDDLLIIDPDKDKDEAFLDSLKAPAEIDLQGQVLQTYRNRVDRKAVQSGVVRERETEAQNAQKNSLNPRQEKGVREICAWMYRNTKKHQKFVEGIAGRTPREKLLIFYIVEKDKRHNVTEQDIYFSQHYVPNVEKFEEKVRYRKHWYKFGGTNINWDAISDAAATAFQVQNVLGAIGKAEGGAPNRESLPLIVEDKEENAKSLSGMKENDRSFDSRSEEDEGSNGSWEEEEKKDLLLKKNGNDSVPEGLEENEIIHEATKKISEINTLAKNLQQEVKVPGGEKNQKTSEMLEDLENSFNQLKDLVKSENFQAEMTRKAEIKQPAGAAGMEKWNAETQKRARYLVLVQAFSNLDINTVKAFKQGLGDSSLIQTFSTTTMTLGMAIDAPIALINLLATIVNFSGTLKSFSSGTWQEIVSKGGAALLSLGNMSKSGLTATRAGASLFADAGWGTTGTSAAAGTLKSITGIGGVVIGGVTTGLGLFNVISTGHRRSLITEAERNLDEPIEKPKGQEEVQKEGQNQILRNLISANRNAAVRQQKAAGLQILQGSLNTASGALTLASGATFGISTIVALGLSGAALIVGISNVIMQNRSKNREIREVIDRYIGMNSLYENYEKKNLNGLRPSQKKKQMEKLGGVEGLKENLRLEAAGVMGFPSLQKMYTQILWQYAQTLYDLTFMKDGRYITKADLRTGLKDDQEKLDDIAARKNYAKLIRSLGFKISIPKGGGAPTPGAAAIHKKLMA